ncbi:hypothetical protein C4D60_Mb06t23970 [Musa balbisiana]|uniref:Uncharacterized protein n=1 Tax=Musa balbisiana TaxID=52838 RepID=A0A4S8IRI3_MUSBA|nr:hypothetical protein C4D60_Mb06t23970 [Musa balbisiana]
MCNTFRELYLSWDVVFRKICHGSLFCQRSFRGRSLGLHDKNVLFFTKIRLLMDMNLTIVFL